MLFGSHRSMDYLANPQITGGSSYDIVGFRTGKQYPVGTQVGDIAVHCVVREVTSEGTPPPGFNSFYTNVLGAIGYASYYTKIVTASDLSTNNIGGATTSLRTTWTVTTRPKTPVSTIVTERLTTAWNQSGSTADKLTMAGTFTSPALILANVFNISGVAVTEAIDIVNGTTKYNYAPIAGNSICIELANTNTARYTNFTKFSSNTIYYEILVAIRGV